MIWSNWRDSADSIEWISSVSLSVSLHQCCINRSSSSSSFSSYSPSSSALFDCFIVNFYIFFYEKHLFWSRDALQYHPIAFAHQPPPPPPPPQQQQQNQHQHPTAMQSNLVNFVIIVIEIIIIWLFLLPFATSFSLLSTVNNDTQTHTPTHPQTDTLTPNTPTED